MQKEKLVSIIIPVYMAEDYIADTIESALNQDYKNIELICVDDASPDLSIDICRHYAKMDNRVKIVNYKSNCYNSKSINKGVVEARNLGLRCSKGDYIMFLDSDDTIESNMVSTMVSQIDHSDVDVVFCTYKTISNDKVQKRECTFKEGIYTTNDFIEHVFDDLPWDILSNIGTKLYKKDTIVNNNLFFSSKYQYNEDTGFILEFIERSKKICFIGKDFYNYYVRPNSISHSYKFHEFDTIISTLDLLMSIFKKNNIYEVKKHKCVPRMVQVSVDSLINEAKFGTIESFIYTCNAIKSHEMFSLMIDTIGKMELSVFHRVIIMLLSFNRFILLLLLIKTRNIIKKKIDVKYYLLNLETAVIKSVFQANNSDGCKVLMFHNVNKTQTSRKCFSINKNDFSEYLEYLKSKGPIYPINQLLEKSQIKSGFIITFDDGYKGVYEHAYPLLKELGIPFTIFVTTDFIDKPGYLTKSQLLKLSSEKLCTIGSHTISHPKLRYCKNIDKEVIGSMCILEKLLNKKIDYFAFPYGSIQAVSNRNIAYLRKKTYKLSFSTIEGYINKRTINLRHFLPRFEGVSEFELWRSKYE